jgi:hypothetical protein
MATTSLPASREEATTRVQRGRDLYTEHADEIRFDSVEKVWLVPSQHDGTSVYEVVLGRRSESCECRDFEFRGGSCKHILAATIARAKSTTCSCCGERVPWKRVTEVQEEDELLAWFPGDVLCDDCVPGRWA